MIDKIRNVKVASFKNTDCTEVFWNPANPVILRDIRLTNKDSRIDIAYVRIANIMLMAFSRRIRIVRPDERLIVLIDTTANEDITTDVEIEYNEIRA